MIYRVWIATGSQWEHAPLSSPPLPPQPQQFFLRLILKSVRSKIYCPEESKYFIVTITRTMSLLPRFQWEERGE